jgi:hypothetical protein
VSNYSPEQIDVFRQSAPLHAAGIRDEKKGAGLWLLRPPARFKGKSVQPWPLLDRVDAVGIEGEMILDGRHRWWAE